MNNNKQDWTFPGENLQFENEYHEGCDQDCREYDEESEERHGNLGNQAGLGSLNTEAEMLGSIRAF